MCCVGSRDWKRKIRKALCRWQKKSSRDVLCGLTCLEEENRYALCAQQKNGNRDALCGLICLKEENCYALGV